MSWFDQSHPTSDGLPYAISRDNELYMTSLRRFHEVSDEFKTQMHAALKTAVDAKDGLSHSFLDKPYDRLFSTLPWVSWDDDPRGGYWVAVGLEHRSEFPPSMWRTHMRISYLRDSEDGETHERNEEALQLHLESEMGSSRNPILLTRLIMDALSLHRLTLHATVVIT